MTYGARVAEDGLRVTSSFRCPACSATTEADGRELWDDARDAFYAAEGRWALQLRDLGPRRLAALRVLRTALDKSPREVVEMAVDARPIFEGTVVEIERIETMLKDLDVDVIRVRL